MTPRRTWRFSLEAKVMAAVLAVLLALPGTTLWMVNRALQDQLQRDAERALSTARGSFEQALRLRTDEMTARFRVARGDPRFLTLLRLDDPPTTEDFLQRSVLEESSADTEFALLVMRDGEIRGARREGMTGDVRAFAAAAEPLVRTALAGEENSGELSLGGIAYHVVAVPVAPPGLPSVALVVGMRIGGDALRKIQPPAAEILILSGNEVAASTLPDPAQVDAVLRQLADNAASAGEEFVLLGGERHKPVTGMLEVVAPADRPLQYVLLWSAEQRLAGFERTRTILLALSSVGILICGGFVWLLVRRLTRPLVALRDGAEAVGRGDFSRRIETFSQDECGELAQAFNQMTANLQRSRAELERAIQQVKLTEAQLIQSEKMSAVGQFVAGVAHELNNPLTAVVGYSELLQTMASDANTRSFLDRIAKSAHRCHKIVESLLSFARQHPPERKLVNVHSALEEILEIMAYDFRTSNVTVVREFAAHLPLILADAHQLQQVFVNILGNARQAMEGAEREGRITLRTRQIADSIVMEFQDNGPGIRRENLARIFDPFFTTKPVGKGTGLGLSLCYGIVQEHGGKISVQSEVGQGATFAIQLPIAHDVTPGAAVVPSAEGGAAAAVASPLCRVLVIDDEQWILDLARELLRTQGHAVEIANGGDEALELLGRRKFDVVVCDWKMPGLNGTRLFDRLREIDPAAARRVLFMTGDVVSDTFQEFLRQNDLTCLAKPFATREFQAAVARVLSQSIQNRPGASAARA